MINDILDDSAKLLFVFMIFVITVDLIIAFVAWNSTRRFVAGARVVNAKIAKLDRRKDGDKADLVFKDSLGNTVNTTAVIQAGKYHENENIEILHDRDRPTKIKVNSFRYLWLSPAAMLQSVVLMSVMLGVLTSMEFAKWPL